MRVLAVTPAFFPQLGGLEQVVLSLAQRVRHFGVTMDVAHVAPEHRHFRAEKVLGVDVFRVPLIGHRFFGYAPHLAGVARGYDLLHVHDPQLLAITFNLRLLSAKVPAVLSTHGGFWHTRRNAFFKKLYERTLLRGSIAHSARVLASSAGDFEYFRRYADNVSLCSNGVDVERFAQVAATPLRSLHRWIYWGRLSRNKRIDRAIDCVAQARRLGHPVDLLICGRDFDALQPELEAQVRRLGLEGCVRLKPPLSDAELLGELGTRGVYINASVHEGFGLGVVEAMAAGLVVMCRDMTPLNGFVEEGRSGQFMRFDGSDVDRFATDRLLRLPAERVATLSAAARASAQPHDWSLAARRFVRHFGEVLAARGAKDDLRARGDQRVDIHPCLDQERTTRPAGLS